MMRSIHRRISKLPLSVAFGGGGGLLTISIVVGDGNHIARDGYLTFKR